MAASGRMTTRVGKHCTACRRLSSRGSSRIGSVTKYLAGGSGFRVHIDKGRRKSFPSPRAEDARRAEAGSGSNPLLIDNSTRPLALRPEGPCGRRFQPEGQRRHRIFLGTEVQELESRKSRKFNAVINHRRQIKKKLLPPADSGLQKWGFL